MVVLDYYSDVLCVWAWIAQRRVEELHEQYADQLEIRYHYLDIFGAVQQKMDTQWSDRGSYAGFGEHVRSAAENYDDAPVNRNCWADTRPGTSANAHLFIKAVESAAGASAATEFAKAVREGFFRDGRDIGKRQVLLDILSERDMQASDIEPFINDGQALAALLYDYQSAAKLKLRGSPSYVMNGERQILYGNVGYRVLSANVEELCKQVSHEASWC